jgi:dTDP-4-amino-4,6-dideoxygalactose transaminase
MISFYRPDFDRSEFLAALGRGGTTRSDFEAAVAARVGTHHGLVFAYGRSGIVALLKALNLTDAEVILPAYTCDSMVRAIVVSGNRPVFVDIDPADYNMSLSALKHSLTSRTRAVVATHTFGYPTNVDAIREIINDPRVIIIEDCAAGFLTFSPGTTAVHGDVGLYSFGHGKHLSTVGGGVLVTNSTGLYEKLKRYRDQNMNRLPVKVWAKRWMRLIVSYALMFSGPIYGSLQKFRYRFIEEYPELALTTMTMVSDYATAYTDFQARMGMVQLGKLDAIIARRRALAEFYDSQLQDIPNLIPAPIINGATYLRYSVRVKRRDEMNLRQRMFDLGVGIERSFHFALPYVKSYQPYARGTYPCARQVAQEVVNLPIYPRLSLEKAEYVAESIRRCLENEVSHR